MIAVFDKNIVIDYLREIPQASAEFGRYDEKVISVVTWIEVMVGATDRESQTRATLAGFEIMDIDRDIAERAAVVRRQHRIKLPDAIIWATARALDLTLVTRNTKDFPANDPEILVPYELH